MASCPSDLEPIIAAARRLIDATDSDIFTDAPECEDAVMEVVNAAAMLETLIIEHEEGA